MNDSISYLMKYTSKGSATDKVGGLPTHLPVNWPSCGCCQEFMPFVGQLYDSEFLPLNGNIALQVYACVDSYNVHLEVVPLSARENVDGIGIAYQDSELFISYTPIKDQVDQWTYMKDIDQYQHLLDTHDHLSKEKVGGLFPNDGSDAPLVTPQNLILAQFAWKPFESMIYIYYRDGYGFYPIGPI